MAMTFTVTLICTACQATLRYEDERPAWKTYDYRVEQADECERSAKFAAEHADAKIPPAGEEWPEYIAAGRPRFLRPVYRGPSDRIELAIPDPYRYVDCPVCDAHIKASRWSAEG